MSSISRLTSLDPTRQSVGSLAANSDSADGQDAFTPLRPLSISGRGTGASSSTGSSGSTSTGSSMSTGGSSTGVSAGRQRASNADSVVAAARPSIQLNPGLPGASGLGLGLGADGDADGGDDTLSTGSSGSRLDGALAQLLQPQDRTPTSVRPSGLGAVQGGTSSALGGSTASQAANGGAAGAPQGSGLQPISIFAPQQNTPAQQQQPDVSAASAASLPAITTTTTTTTTTAPTILPQGTGAQQGVGPAGSQAQASTAAMFRPGNGGRLPSISSGSSSSTGSLGRQPSAGGTTRPSQTLPSGVQISTYPQLAANKQRLEAALDRTNATDEQRRTIVAIAMQESNTMSIGERDGSKDSMGGAANVSILNINKELLKDAGFKGDPATLNNPANLPQACQGLVNAMNAWGTDGALNYMRGGKTGFNDGVSYDCSGYRSAIKTISRCLQDDPALMTDGRRVEINVKHV